MCNKTFLVMSCYWIWPQCNMMLMASSMVLLYSLRQDDWNEAIMTFCSCDAICICFAVTWCWQLHQWNHYIPCGKIVKMRCNMTFSSCNATSNHVNATPFQVLSMAPLHSWVKITEMRHNMIFWSCHTIGTSISIMWYQQHHQWHHCIL